MATNTIRNRSGTARAHTHRRTAHIRGIRERLRAPCRSRLSCTAMEKAIHLRKNNNKTNNPEKRMKLVKWLGKKTDTKNEQTSNENTHNWMLSRFLFSFYFVSRFVSTSKFDGGENEKKTQKANKRWIGLHSGLAAGRTLFQFFFLIFYFSFLSFSVCLSILIKFILIIILHVRSADQR